ncbi:MAG: transcriptional regulator [Zetaproteobacteria bacterium]|nr:MAG: transcriptional regulator [Zetaproteobacteria bacterium]
MVSLITAAKAQGKISKNAQLKRLEVNLTQKELATRSGVPLPTLRKFEQKGTISLEAYLKIQMVLGGLEKIIQAGKPSQNSFSSIDEVLDDYEPQRQRARGT